MGKLHLDNDDINRISQATGGRLQVEDGTLQLPIGDAKLTLTDLTTRGHIDQNGIRFDISATYDADGLKVEFE